jgi:hypothetical protein
VVVVKGKMAVEEKKRKKGGSGRETRRPVRRKK